jgi:hypothetical protein
MVKMALSIGSVIWRKWSLALVVVVVFGILSCGQENQIGSARTVSSMELLELNERKVRSQSALIDSIALAWAWTDATDFSHRPSGMRLRPLRSRAERLQMNDGDTIFWKGKAMLLDSTVVFDWPDSAPFSLIVNASNWPLGFHELATAMGEHEALEALLPSHLGWGLSGWLPMVPQDAVLWMQLEMVELRGQQTEAMKVDTLDKWNRLIDAFELGSWGADKDWITAPKLIASPCIAWCDESTELSGLGWSTGDAVSISVRTFESGIGCDGSRDFGWNQWEFRMGDDQQVLPVLEMLMDQNRTQTRWECHCPVEYVFGSQGVPNANLLAGDIVGFQWEIDFNPRAAAFSEQGLISE